MNCIYCVDGHTLRNESNNTVIYTCLMYFTSIEMKEQVLIKDGAIAAIFINTIYRGMQTSAPGNPDWHSKLEHIRDMLKGLMPDEEVMK